MMTDQQLLQALDWMKATMISVATGGARIGDVQATFVQRFDEVASELAERRMGNPLPYRDLWEWYGRWSSGDMPSWQSRREFVNGMFGPLIRNVQAHPLLQRPIEPAGWDRVDRNVTEVRKGLAIARNEEQFQAVGLHCREALISLAQAVYDRETHGTLDGVPASSTDAKRMLEAYIAVAFGGGEHEQLRKHARAAYDLAAHLQHRRTATFRQAAASTEATTSVVNLIAIMAGRRDPA